MSLERLDNSIPAGGLIAGAASAGAGILGGLIGNSAASGDYQAALQAKQAALQQILGIDAPTAAQMAVNLSKEQSAGSIDPTMEGTVQQGASAMQGISTNPQLRQAQMNALSQLQQLGNTGLSASDRAALMQITNQASSQASALNKSALAQAAQRGMAGGGAELAARLIGGQSAANQGAQAGLNVASQAQQKALQAMSNAGALGGQMESQQFGEDAQKAAAADAISRFNTANRQQVLNSNTGAQNQAQYANLSNLQNIMNSNTNINNQQATYNSQMQQQAYNDALNKAKAASGQQNVLAGQYQTQAANTADMWSGIGQGVGQGIAGVSKGMSGSTGNQGESFTPSGDDYEPTTAPGTQYGAANDPYTMNKNTQENDWSGL